LATKLGIELERSGLPMPQHVLTAAQLVDELCLLS